jgi:hypothetical protein
MTTTSASRPFSSRAAHCAARHRPSKLEISLAAVLSVDASAKVEIELASHRVEIGQTQATSLDLASAIVGAGFTPMELDAPEPVPNAGGGCGGCSCH